MQSSVWPTGRLVCLMLGVLLATGVAEGQKPAYPPTPRSPVLDEVHGVMIEDPYRWLEDVSAPQVQQWVAAQNAFTRSYLDRFATQRDQLKQRYEELFGKHIASPPQVFGERLYFFKREGLQNHAVMYLREGGLEAEAKVALNPNKFSEDGLVALDWYYPSPDGKLVVYGKSEGGSERSTLYLRDVTTGKDAELEIPNTRYSSVAWDADGGGFTYTRYPEPGTVPAGDENYFKHVYYHELGGDWQQDPKIWGAGRPKEEMPGVYNSSDYRYQFLTIHFGWAKNYLYIRKMGAQDFTPVAVGLDGLFSADVVGDKLFVLTDHQAPRFRVMVSDVDQPQPENWEVLIPEQKGVIKEMVVADGMLVLRTLENAYSRVLIYDLKGQLVKEVELPTLGTVSSLTGRPGRHDFFFEFESFMYPPVVFHYDLRTHTMKPLDQMEVGVDRSQYETRQVWFNSKDGTRVPMFVTFRKGVELDGSAAAVLSGYGGFNIANTPRFSRAVIPWLEAGGIWAVANIRGGGEFGKDWHLAGQLEKKQNVFDDFIAAGEKLIADKYTSRARLGGRGGSNGGLLIGAMLVQRPDLFRALYCAVPLLDMVRYHQFEIARLWIPEYGSVEDPKQFEFIYAYSPYHHVEQGTAYPSVLFTTAMNDTRVMPMHAFKMAARVQRATTSDLPVLLLVETGAGHGAGKPLNKYIEDAVDQWSYFMWQLGMFDKELAGKPAGE